MERGENLFNDGETEWKDVKIRGAKYMISTSMSHNSWKISLSNLVEIWTETITKDVALARCQSLNLLLDLDSFDVKETLDAMLSDIPKHATEKSVDEIKLENYIDGIAFKFHIKLAKGSPQEFWNQITKPLCQSSTELQRRHKILLELIKKKDEEISEYKLSGAEITRKNIETLPYNEEIFRDKKSIGISKSDDCMQAFRSMMDVCNELKNYELSLNNFQRLLPRESSDPNPVDPDVKIKHENPEVSERTISIDDDNGEEPQSRIGTEPTTVNPQINENESIVRTTEIIEQVGVSETSPSINECKISLRAEKIRNKRSTTTDTAMPLASTDRPIKRTKPRKVSPNIYDFIS